MKNGERNLVLEHGLAQLEDQFVRMHEEKIRFGSRLTNSERYTLLAFMAAMHARTPSQREHHRAQWTRVQKSMDGMMEWAKTASLQKRKNAASIRKLN